MKTQDEKELPVIACGVALIHHGGQFLIAQRNADDSFGSFWEFPGGKKNADESFEDCCVRETMEETGIVIQAGEKLMELKRRYNERVIWLNFYLCSYVSGDPRPIDCQKVQWADLNELSHFTFPPANELVIQKLREIYG